MQNALARRGDFQLIGQGVKFLIGFALGGVALYALGAPWYLAVIPALPFLLYAFVFVVEGLCVLVCRAVDKIAGDSMAVTTGARSSLRCYLGRHIGEWQTVSRSTAIEVIHELRVCDRCGTKQHRFT